MKGGADPLGKRKGEPMHPGAVVRGTLDPLAVSPRQAELAIGMTPAGLGKVINGQRPVNGTGGYNRDVKDLHTAKRTVPSRPS